MQIAMPATAEHHFHVLSQLVDAPPSQRRIFGLPGILPPCASLSPHPLPQCLASLNLCLAESMRRVPPRMTLSSTLRYSRFEPLVGALQLRLDCFLPLHPALGLPQRQHVAASGQHL
jgi:hypothetical protein